MSGRLTTLWLRFLGALGLFIGAAGLPAALVTLFAFVALDRLAIWARRADTTVALAMLVASVLDLAAYVALLFLSLSLIRLRQSVRGLAICLAVYFIFMGVAQQVAIYRYFVQPEIEHAVVTDGLRVKPPPLGFIVGVAAVLVLYGTGLLLTAAWWRVPARRGVTPPARPAAKGAMPSAPRPGSSRASTNAPRTWPVVEVDQWLPEMPFYAQLAVVTRLIETFGKRPDAQIALAHTRLYEDGVLRVPILIEEAGQRTAVFVYSEASPQTAAHYSAVRTLLRQREGTAAVYYAPAPLTPTAGGMALERLDTPHFSRPGKDRPAAEYALWWPTPDEPRLCGAQALAHLEAWFESLAGIHHLLFSSFVKTLELEEEDSESDSLYALPAQALMLPLDGPGDLKLYIHASRADGLWLAFDVRQTSAADRNRLLGLLAGMARALRGMVDAPGRSGLLADRAEAVERWRRTRTEALEAEAAGKAGVQVGCILEIGEARICWPGASSADQRAEEAARERASEALTEFARSQVDEAFRRIERRPPEESGEGAQEPNLNPFVAVRSGAEAHRVTLSRFTEPEAVAFAPSVVSDYGDVEAVAAVCDGVLRLEGERFDAVVVRAQERGTSAVHVFSQRYRLASARGAAEMLGNWALWREDGSLFPPPPDQTAASASPCLLAFVREIADETLAWIRTGDGSGADTYDRDEPLFSAAVHVRTGDETTLHRFLMGNLAWAQGATLQVLSDSPGATIAVFVYDCVRESNGLPHRALRFQGHERGTAYSWLYEQRYEEPRKGTPFRTTGALSEVRRGRPLFES